MSIEWVSASDAIERLSGKSDDPRKSILQCVRGHNARSRASVILRDGQKTDAPPHTKKSETGKYILLPAFWNFVEQYGHQDWSGNYFGYKQNTNGNLFESDTILEWLAVEVEFYWPDIQFCLRSEFNTTVRKKRYPPTWKPTNAKHEQAAVLSAEIVRREGVSLAEAFRQAQAKYFPHPTDRTEQSIQRSIRYTFDLLYMKDGTERNNQ